MAAIPIPYTFVTGTIIDPDQMNANFQAIAVNAVSDVSGVLDSPSLNNPTVTGGLLFSPDATVDIGQSGAYRPRDLFLARNAVVGGTLGVTGLATIAAVNVTTNASVGGTLGVTGLATIAAVNVTTNASVGGALTVTGNETVGGTLNVTGPVGLTSTLNVTLNTGLGGTLDVMGTTTVHAPLTVTGLTTLQALNVTNILTVQDAGVFNNNVTVQGLMRAVGGVQSDSTLTVNGPATVGGTLGVTGLTTLASLSVTGTATVANLNATSLGVSGNASVTGVLSAGSSLGVTTDLTVAGLIKGLAGTASPNLLSSGTVSGAGTRTLGGAPDSSAPLAWIAVRYNSTNYHIPVWA